MSHDPPVRGPRTAPPIDEREAAAVQRARRSLLIQASALLSSSLLPALTACGGDSGPAAPAPAPAPAGPSVQADVSFQSVATAVHVDSRFAGLSYEKNKLAVPLFTGTNAALIQLFRLLGPSVLRIGANAVDRSSWNGAISGLTAILPGQIDALADFLQATQWQVIYGVSLARNTPGNAADEAAYVAKRLGSSLLAWEIGNEPDLYRRLGYRPDSWGYADYLKEWRAVRDAMSAASPGVAFSGPATAFDLTRVALPFAKDEGAGVPMLTQHYYRADGEDAGSTLDLLLQPDPNLQSELAILVKAASDAGMALGMRYDECNSFFDGGAPNISNAYGTALWVMDFMFTCAVAGCTGVNLHGGGKGPGYTPIADSDGTVVEVRPEFYGLLMFTQASPGAPMAGTVTSSASMNLNAWGVARADGGLNVVLMNKDATSGVSMNVATGIAAGSFDPMWLRGSALSATTGQTLGGVGIGNDGSWTPQPQAPLSASGGLLSVPLPPASAVLLRSL